VAATISSPPVPLPAPTAVHTAPAKREDEEMEDDDQGDAVAAAAAAAATAAAALTSTAAVTSTPTTAARLSTDGTAAPMSVEEPKAKRSRTLPEPQDAPAPALRGGRGGERAEESPPHLAPPMLLPTPLTRCVAHSWRPPANDRSPLPPSVATPGLASEVRCRQLEAEVREIDHVMAFVAGALSKLEGKHARERAAATATATTTMTPVTVTHAPAVVHPAVAASAAAAAAAAVGAVAIVSSTGEVHTAMATVAAPAAAAAAATAGGITLASPPPRQVSSLNLVECRQLYLAAYGHTPHRHMNVGALHSELGKLDPDSVKVTPQSYTLP